MRRHRTDTRFAAAVATHASLGAGLVHLAVTPGHWEGWAPSGIFFIALAAFQICWAGALFIWRTTAVMGIGVIANIGSIALWAASRLWGSPIGPNAGVPEAVDLPGVTAVLLEATVVVSGLWFLLPRHQSAIFSAGGYRLGLSGAALVVLALTAPGAVAGLDHSHNHSHDHTSHEPGPDESPASISPPPTTNENDSTEQEAPDDADLDQPPASDAPTAPSSEEPSDDGHDHQH